MDPLLLNLNAVLNFHQLIDVCAKCILSDFDAAAAAMRASDAATEEDSGGDGRDDGERRTRYDNFQVRWTFCVQHLFVDWHLWSSRCSPVAALQHARQLLKKVKLNRRFYRAHLPISCLLNAVGFFFA